MSKTAFLTTVLVAMLARPMVSEAGGGKGGGVAQPGAFSLPVGIEIPPLGAGEVTMPWVEFAKLLDALRTSELPKLPPVSYAIEKASYVCTVDEKAEKAHIDAVFSVKVLDEGWTTVSLLMGGVAIEDFTITGAKDVSLVQSWGRVDALARGPSSFEVRLSMTRPIDSDHGTKNLWVEGPQAVSGRLECTIAAKGIEIKVDPGIVEEKLEQDGTVKVKASLVSGGSFALKWWEEVQIPDAEKKDLPVKMYGDVNTLLRIGEGLMRGVSSIDYSILQSGVEELRILVPEDISVTDVKGSDLAEWEVRDEDGARVLHAFLSYKVKNYTSLSVSYDKSMGKASAVVQAPCMTLVGVERETGTFGVEVLTNVEVKVESMSGLTQVDSSELTSSVMWSAEHPILLGFKYIKHPFDLVLDVKKHEDVPILVATVDVADFTTLHTNDGKQLTRVLLSMRNNMKQFLKIELPEGSEVWSTHVSDKPVKPGKDDEGRILVPLEKSNSGGSSMQGFLVEIVYLTKVKALGVKGTGHVELCTFDLPITHLQWSLYLPDRYRYKKFEGNVDEWEGEFTPLPQAAARDAYDIIQKKQLEPQANVYEMNIDMDQAMAQSIGSVQSMTKGVLPVKLSVPQQGKLSRFVKLIVIDEAAEITFKYRLPLKYR